MAEASEIRPQSLTLTAFVKLGITKSVIRLVTESVSSRLFLSFFTGVLTIF